MSLPARSNVYIIAELSANHGGSIGQALQTISAIKESGADAVKLQTYTADTLTLKSDRPEFRVGKGSLWAGRTLYDLYEEAHTPWEWHAELFSCAASLGLECFSTPFDNTAVDFLEQFNPPYYKIASFELVDLPLIEYVASQKRPIIMSTGMGTLDEISAAVEVVQRANVPLTLLKCTSAYPAPPETMNLVTIPDLAKRFSVPVGLSDHTLGIAVPVAAVALGATVIEKHFTMSRQQPGPDSAFSLEPDEFRQMVAAVRDAEKALGEVAYSLSPEEEASRVFRRSLFAVKDIAAGERLTLKNIRSIRPGAGLPPAMLPSLIGRTAKAAIAKGTPLRVELVNFFEKA